MEMTKKLLFVSLAVVIAIVAVPIFTQSLKYFDENQRERQQAAKRECRDLGNRIQLLAHEIGTDYIGEVKREKGVHLAIGRFGGGVGSHYGEVHLYWQEMTINRVNPDTSLGQEVIGVRIGVQVVARARRGDKGRTTVEVYVSTLSYSADQFPKWNRDRQDTLFLCGLSDVTDQTEPTDPQWIAEHGKQ